MSDVTDPMHNIPIIMEQIRSIVETQKALATQLESLHTKLESTYVPKGTYEAHRESDDRRFKELEKDNESGAAFRRQVAAGFIVGFLMLLVPLLGTINQAIGGQ